MIFFQYLKSSLFRAECSVSHRQHPDRECAGTSGVVAQRCVRRFCVPNRVQMPVSLVQRPASPQILSNAAQQSAVCFQRDGHSPFKSCCIPVQLNAAQLNIRRVLRAPAPRRWVRQVSRWGHCSSVHSVRLRCAFDGICYEACHSRFKGFSLCESHCFSSGWLVQRKHQV